MNTLSDELKEQEYLGYWWLPTNDVQQHDDLAGVIRFAPNSRSELELLGSFGKTMPQVHDKCPVVNGAAHGTKWFTLFDCYLRHCNQNFSETIELAAVRYCFADGWIGSRPYSSKDDIRFLRFTAGIDGLASWHDAKAFSWDYDPDSNITVLRYQRPDFLELYKDDWVEIKLGYCREGPSLARAQRESVISHDPRILIDSLGGELPYYGGRGSYRFYLDRLRTILGLMIGLGCPLYDCVGSTEVRRSTSDDGVAPKVELRHWWRRDIEDAQSISPWEIWLPHKDVADYIQTAIGKFMVLDDDCAGLAGHIVYMNASRRTDFTQKVLPELIYLFEGLYRGIWRPKKCRGEVLSPWLKAEFSRIGNIFSFLDSDAQDKLIKYVKARRNNYAHANPESYSKNIMLYIHATNWLRMFLTAMLFDYCEIPVSVILSTFCKQPEFIEFAKDLKPMLNDWFSNND